MSSLGSVCFYVCVTSTREKKKNAKNDSFQTECGYYNKINDEEVEEKALHARSARLTLAHARLRCVPFLKVK